LTSRTALITGASRGIGAACAHALADDGYDLILVARTGRDLEHLAEKLTTTVHVLPCDLSIDGGGRRLGHEVLDRIGSVDVLINNAGRALDGRTARLDPAMVHQVITLNLVSALELSGVLAPAMTPHAGCSIVNMSSISGMSAVPFSAVYASTKGGLDGLTRSLAAEYGPRGIRVNGVAPGVIVTDAWTPGREIPDMIETLEGRVALRRWGDPAEVASVVSFLVSDRASYMTGQTLVVDGGLSLLLEPIPRPAEVTP
jgi:NAD(P)-dependent dehydrogenase (short-subunit alcohol dehydrogenase family)